MSATTNIKSANITVLDTAVATGYAGVPFLTAGEGAPDRVVCQVDKVAWPATNMDAGSWVRLARIPANAVIKKLEIKTDAEIDNTSTTATLKLAVGVMFSDGKDGTPASYASLVPALAADGTTVADPATANANDVFYSTGTDVNLGAAAQTAIPWTDITFQNIANLTTAPGLAAALQTTLLGLFNFTNKAGQNWKDGGFFDIYVRVVAAATTQAGANMLTRVWYTNRG